MPQPRQRIVFCDCLDCVEQLKTTDVPSAISPANEAAARQEPPPKCLLLLLTGALAPLTQDPNKPTVLEEIVLPHLDRVTREGCLTLLTARADSGTGDEVAQSQLAQLLGVYEERREGKALPSLQERFKGMVALHATNLPSTAPLATAAGCIPAPHLQLLLQPQQQQQQPPSHQQQQQGQPRNKAQQEVQQQEHGEEVQQEQQQQQQQHDSGSDAADGGGDGLLDMFAPPASHRGAAKAGTDRAAADAAGGGGSAASPLPDAAETARTMLQELGLQDAAQGADMLLVHLDLAAVTASSSSSSSSTTAAAAKDLLMWVDRVQRYLNNSTLFKETVLSVLVLTPPPGAAPPTPPPTGPSATPAANGAASDGSAAAAAGGGGGNSSADQQDCKQGLQKRYNPVNAVHPGSQGGWFVPGAGDEGSAAGVQRPVQSWQQLGGKLLPAGVIDAARPMLCCRRLPGVIRVDCCSRLSLVEGYLKGGMGPLMCDRLLAELAYKLGRAHKYGA